MDLISKIKNIQNSRLAQSIQADINNRGQGGVGPTATAATVGSYFGGLGDDLRRQQVRNIEARATRDLMQGKSGVQKNVAQVIADARYGEGEGSEKEYILRKLRGETMSGDTGRTADRVTAQQMIEQLGDHFDSSNDVISRKVANQYAKQFAPLSQEAAPPISARSAAIKLSDLAAANPEAAIGTLAGTGAVGGVALITASGAALDDLSNFLAGGQQNQDTRDNVLRS